MFLPLIRLGFSSLPFVFVTGPRSPVPAARVLGNTNPAAPSLVRPLSPCAGPKPTSGRAARTTAGPRTQASLRRRAQPPRGRWCASASGGRRPSEPRATAPQPQRPAAAGWRCARCMRRWWGRVRGRRRARRAARAATRTLATGCAAATASGHGTSGARTRAIGTGTTGIASARGRGRTRAIGGARGRSLARRSVTAESGGGAVMTAARTIATDGDERTGAVRAACSF
jgi:hypothetical protein